MRILRICTSGILALALPGFLTIVLFGSESLRSVNVRHTGEGKEHSDKYVPGMNKEEKAPDYILEVRAGDSWQMIGAHSNRYMEDEILMFESKDPIPTRNIHEIRLSDKDPLESDVLELLAFSEGELAGKNYSFEVELGFSLMAGLAYFWSTYIGKAILLGITIGIVLLILSALGP